jgi:hypothetical protein
VGHSSPVWPLSEADYKLAAAQSPRSPVMIVGSRKDGSKVTQSVGDQEGLLATPPLRSVTSDDSVQLQQASVRVSGNGLHYRGTSSAPGTYPPAAAAGHASCGPLSGNAAKAVYSPKPGRGRRQGASVTEAGGASADPRKS